MRWIKTIFLTVLSLAIIVPSEASTTPNIWDVLRQEFSLNHETHQPEVQNQIRWLVAHPSYLHQLAQSEPYIYHIVTEIRKRHIPGEIALLPMIESAYDPFAYSGVGAAGLWQLMPGTGTNLGLKQDWWYDGRRSIGPSTNAALHYLVYLHHYFEGNWILAIAAYDSGEGTVARVLKNSNQRAKNARFWRLPLPSETRAYVPRLLALAEVIKYPQRYHVTLPDIPHTPYFEEVNIGSQIDLNHAAQLAGMTYKDLLKLNPGFNRWTTAPYKPFKLLIPKNKVAHFSHNLSLLPQDKRVSWTRHQVHSGESIRSIASLYYTTPNLIRELNQLKSDSLKRGQYILIPSTRNTPAPIHQSVKPISINKKPSYHRYKVVHIVQSGEDYAGLEKKYHVSAKDIRQWNRLQYRQTLRKGQALTIWRTLLEPGSYQVTSGDTIIGIAKKNQTSVSTLKKLNPSIENTILKPGQTILIG